MTLLISSTGAKDSNESTAKKHDFVVVPGPIPRTVRDPAAICVRPL